MRQQMIATALVGVLWCVASAASAQGLSSADVKRWMLLRVETGHLQNQFRQKAAHYDDLPRAYFAARDKFLNENNYPPARFDADEQRIYHAVDTRREYDQMRAEQARRDDELAAMKAAPDPMADPEFRQTIQELRAVGLSEDQIQQVIAAKRQMPDLMAEADRELDSVEQQSIEATRPDWDGVTPWLEELDALQDWLAGNRPSPPVLR